MPAGGRLAVVVAVSVLCTPVWSPSPRADIRKKVGPSGELIVTNVGTRTHGPGRRSGGPSAAGKAGESPAPPPRIGRLLVSTSAKYGFDPALIRAVVLAESAFDPMAVSRKGARGLMQLMPATARQFGVGNVHDPEDNLEAGVAYLRQLALRYDGRMDLALAAYNAGPEAVSRYGGIPPYEETRSYLSRIRRQFGHDLDKGDWGSRQGRIRVTSVESGGVLHFTNVRRRRIISPSGGADGKPPKGPARGKGE